MSVQFINVNSLHCYVFRVTKLCNLVLLARLQVVSGSSSLDSTKVVLQVFRNIVMVISPVVTRLCGVVVITSASHAEGRGFEPRHDL